MDIKRNILLVGLAIVSYLMLLAWNEDYPAEAPEAAAQPAGSAQDIARQGVDLPTAPVPVSTPAEDLPQATAQAPAAITEPPAANTRITVTTPKQIVTIDPKGGDIIGVSLPDFPVSIETPDIPFSLLRLDAGMTYVSQSGLIGRDGPDANPAGRPDYRSAQTDYSLDSGTLDVDLVYTDADGIAITKRFSFNADDYLIRVSYLINNQGTGTWQGNMFGQIKRDGSPDPSDTGSFSLNTYLGAALTTPESRYEKIDFDDMDDNASRFEVTGGWIAFSQHYFLSSWIPGQNAENVLETRKNAAGEYLMTFVSPALAVQPGETGTIDAGFWAGPKDQYRLDEIADDLERTIDYGKFYIIASPIFWLLTQINNLVGNYGLAILLMTVVIKTILYPLSAKSYRSTAKMRKLTPKINELKDKYGDDKQRFMQAQMELWKKEKVNPFGGCLPMLLQLPVFLGIFWVLNESVELRQASFILWYDDLSQMDPFFLLPLLMGAAMFVQQTLTPMQMADPAQAKMMKFMPLIFTVFFLWFPAGLVLYYTANSVLSILQQWYITRQVERTYRPKSG